MKVLLIYPCRADKIRPDIIEGNHLRKITHIFNSFLLSLHARKLHEITRLLLADKISKKHESISFDIYRSIVENKNRRCRIYHVMTRHHTQL